ncbi:hypothetical protein JB92DRAFT_3094048 [Gautieria morchelliformis]|nr:hypothetical protein JB92DRAFT_3094048 [Gautieria morchelliformis]
MAQHIVFMTSNGAVVPGWLKTMGVLCTGMVSEFIYMLSRLCTLLLPISNLKTHSVNSLIRFTVINGSLRYRLHVNHLFLPPTLPQEDDSRDMSLPQCDEPSSATLFNTLLGHRKQDALLSYVIESAGEFYQA